MVTRPDVKSNGLYDDRPLRMLSMPLLYSDSHIFSMTSPSSVQSGVFVRAFELHAETYLRTGSLTGTLASTSDRTLPIGIPYSLVVPSHRITYTGLHA